MNLQRNNVKLADEALLANLGYKQELKRAFTPFEVFGVAFSIIGLVPSIASVLFNAIPNGGAVSVVWGWAIASVLILCIAMALAELASAAPTSGGMYYWTYSLSSPRCRTLLCWIVGYANTIGTITALASVDWSCAIQITAAVSMGTNRAYTTNNAQLYGIYAAIVLLHAFIVSLGTNILAKLQILYTVLNVCLCLALIIGLPVATPSEFRNEPSYALGDFTNLNGWPSGFAFIMGLLYPMWTIGGYDSSVHMSEEASNAATAVPWAIVSSVSVAGILGWAISLSIVFCMGTDLESLINSPIGQPMAQIFFNSFGQKGALVIWAMIVLVQCAQFMMGSSCLLAASRQTFAFSRDGALPLSRYLYRINSFTKTPVNTVWFCAVIALLLGSLAFAGTEAINAIFTIPVTALYISYMIPIFARFAFKNSFKHGPFHLGFMSFPVSMTALSFMFFMDIVFFFPATPQTTVNGMNYTVVVLGGVLFLAVTWYYLPVYGGVNWFKGPVANTNPNICERGVQENGVWADVLVDSKEKEEKSQVQDAVNVVQDE
ncbi:amino acid/polyamine transporter I [Hygrophoropsis aurantiaca]|uniref:Amino acid/polyamine transporter I n=1 Tax=Hygrophoropsis aurantiaca TaxID=72124 RepID=A0ACB8AIW8_9AGAM|nr:amino acid/polyamine transporter I [Hygrophoropsis aurantiaca]